MVKINVDILQSYTNLALH